MIKCLLSIFFVMTMVIGSPTVVRANTAVDLIDTDFQNITISVTESSIRVSGAAGQMLSIYNVAGIRIAFVKVESADKHFDFNLPKGCYIVKVGKVVRKIAIK